MYIPSNKQENVDQDLVENENIPDVPDASRTSLPELKIDPDFASKKQINNINNIASAQSVQSNEQQPEKRNGRKVLIVILVLLLFAGIGAACFYVATTGNNAPANTNTQAKNSEPKIKVTSVSANIDDFDKLNVLIDIESDPSNAWDGSLTCSILNQSESTIAKKTVNEHCNYGSSKRLKLDDITDFKSIDNNSRIRILDENNNVLFEEENPNIILQAIEKHSMPIKQETTDQLRGLIGEIEALNKNDYSPSSFSTLETALNKGRNALNRGTTETEAQKIILEINNAKNALVNIAPIIIEGQSDDVVDIPQEYEPGLIYVQYRGGGNFSIWSCNDKMEHDDLLVNTIGNYDGRVSTIFGHDKDKYLEISSEGSWRVTFSPIIAMPELANDQVMTGDDVVALKSNSLKLNIKNTGESNFVVRGITSDYKVDLLVNEIGNYEGTVPNRDYKILVVESEGAWQISW